MNAGEDSRDATEFRNDDAAVLELLQTIDGQAHVSQRRLAEAMGVALGLANSYLRRCVRKGLVKVRQAPPNRYLYYLTPKGFAEKSRLTAQYLKYSFAFYRRASDACAAVFERCAASGIKKVVLAGVSELAEVATLRANERGVELVAIYDPGFSHDRFSAIPVVADLANVGRFDVCVLTEIAKPEARYLDLIEQIGASRIVVPSVLQPALRSILANGSKS